MGEGKDFKAAEAETASWLQGNLVSLQEQVMGKGAFRSFVEVRLARGTEVQVACGSAAFAAAAAGIIKCSPDLCLLISAADTAPDEPPSTVHWLRACCPAWLAEERMLSRQELAAVTSKMAASADKPGDRDSLLGVLALGALVFRCGEEQGAFDKKLLRQLLDLHQQVC